MSHPTWLLEHLIRAGHITERGISRKARVRTCERCGRVALVGLDADVCAFEVAADPLPLSRLGEALALVEGRRTFALVRTHRGYELDARDASAILGRPAGATKRQDVLAEHRCSAPGPGPALLAETAFPEHRPATYTHPPF